MRILFSPVGDSDPIRDMYDGSCLHILRHYKPDAVKLFLSKDMADKENRDHRFTTAIKHLSQDIKILPMEITDIVQANSFDIYMEYFPKSILKLIEEYPEAEILINISSGTTQMKTTLAMLSVDLPRCKGIQVSTPARGSNRRNRPEQDEIDVDELIATNLDDEPDSPNRCEEPSLSGIKNFREKNQILSLIRARRYGAAWELAKDPASTMSDTTRHLLEYGLKRSKLELKAAKEVLINKLQFDKKQRGQFHNIKDEAENLFEYFLVMQNNVLNKDYAELLTKITPFMYELLKNHMQHNIGDDFLEKCCEARNNGTDRIYRIKCSKVEAWNKGVLDNLDRKFYPEFKDGSELAFINMYHIISSPALVEVTPTNKRLVSILSAENGIDVKKLNNLRNSVAHNIRMNVTEDRFINEIGLSPQKLIDILFDMVCTVFSYKYKAS